MRKKAITVLRNMGPLRTAIKEACEKTFSIVKFLCVLHVTKNYLIEPVMTHGPSMLPTIDATPTIFLTERISTRFGKVAHGDIVVLRSPHNPRETVGKRLVGLEGDIITCVCSPENSDKHETVVVPKGHVWVEGDNKYNSNDSRSYGPVPYGLIENKLFWRVSPDFGSFCKK